MKQIKIGNSNISASQIALGCMTMGGSWDNSPISSDVEKKALDAISCALDEGINFFDHADIYTKGKSEQVFSKIWDKKSSLREKIILQSKCGIRFQGEPESWMPPRYDFSKEHIISSVEGILKRLNTEYLDILLLHRPDALVEPEEVAEAFEQLYTSGKVREFGVSNHNSFQMELLKKYINRPLVANQMELSLVNANLIEEGMYVNSQVNNNIHMRSNGTMEYCRLNDITVQAWSPLAGGRLTKDNVEEPYKELAKLISLFAEEKNVSKEAIVLAWLLRHPAKIQPIIGTTNPERIQACCQADKITLSREEWYKLFNAFPERNLL